MTGYEMMNAPKILGDISILYLRTDSVQQRYFF
jgi:hypothetical protein